MVAIVLYDRPNVVNERVDRLSLEVSNRAQGSMLPHDGIVYLKRLVQARRRHAIDASDVRQRHPGADRIQIACQNSLMILLKLLIGPDRACSGKNRAGQCHTQEQADAYKLQTYIQN